jgi:cytochrome c oxidase subunit II
VTAPLPLGARARAWTRRPEVRGIFLLWVVLTALLCLFSFVPSRLMGTAASPTMQAIKNTMTVFTLAAAPVAALVWAVAVYSLVKWRHRGSEPPEDARPSMRNNGPASAIWLVTSSVLCVFLLIWGLAEMQSMSASAATSNPLVVNVTGQQWVWTFSYPQQGKVESDQLYLPVNRPVVFHVTSDDVVHSFWVVEMGIKVDANPGATTTTSVTPNRLGTFDVRCAELCGLLHADMETTVHVVDSSAFASWVLQNGGHV